jgi:uncharacterized protein (TIGR02466 family)|tara:strand:- start:193 stop:804 length:612 start_codon:yes stop_codon:yes gene_type:complete
MGNVMRKLNHQKIFPTHIFQMDNFYGFRKELLDNIHLSYEPHIPNWQSRPNLHQSENFKNFSDQILETSKEAIRTLKYDFDDIRITDMWANVLKPGEYHAPHTHSNNFLSGVWYAEAENTSGICFSDPRTQANVIVPSSNPNIDTATVLEYKAESNRIYLFPSWISHWVPVLKENKTRTSVSWNVQLYGNVGKSTTYQSAFFQ